MLATQNPIEMEGTYRLPEAQIDRFLFKTIVSYPSEQELDGILDKLEQMQPSPDDATYVERAGKGSPPFTGLTMKHGDPFGPENATHVQRELRRHNRDLGHLIVARQDGRFIIYSANFGAMNDLIGFLTESCCGGNPCGPAFLPKAATKKTATKPMSKATAKS